MDFILVPDPYRSRLIKNEKSLENKGVPFERWHLLEANPDGPGDDRLGAVYPLSEVHRICDLLQKYDSDNYLEIVDIQDADHIHTILRGRGWKDFLSDC